MQYILLCLRNEAIVVIIFELGTPGVIGFDQRNLMFDERLILFERLRPTAHVSLFLVHLSIEVTQHTRI